MRTKVSSITLLAGILLILVPVVATGSFSGAGSGTEADPYIITNVPQLQEMNDDLDAWYELGNDIDAYDTENWNGGEGFSPIGRQGGTAPPPFTGSFDGRGYAIAGLYINRPDSRFVGLFGVTGGSVKNVVLESVDVTGNWFTGGLAGTSNGNVVINCHVTGDVKGTRVVGGVLGYLSGLPTVECLRCSFHGNVTNTGEHTGGLVGFVNNASLSNCYSTSTVTGAKWVGGLLGYNQNGKVDKCYSAGQVSGTTMVGGLLGDNYGFGTCAESFWDVEASGQSWSAGGTGKTTAEMKQQATFTNWDFDTVWDIVEGQGYPFLRGVGGQEPPEEPPMFQKVVERPLVSTLTNPSPFVRATVSYRPVDDITYEVLEVRFSSQGVSSGLIEFGIFPHETYFPPLPPLPGTAKWKTIFFTRGDERVFSLSLIVHRSDVMSLSFGGVADGSTYFGIDVRVLLLKLAADLIFNAVPVTTTFEPDAPVSQETSQGLTFELARLGSPAELRAYDPDDRITGFVDGHQTEEIPNSMIIDDSIIILQPSDSYRYEVAGTGDGTYELAVASIENDEVICFTATAIPTSDSAIHKYDIDWEALSSGEEGVILEIDNNGDGFFEQMAIADNELSYDEFALQTKTVVDFDPDTLNLNSEGKFVTVYIELPEDIDASEIDLFSLELNELVPPLPKPIEIGDYDSDGTNDLMVKFDIQELIEVLEPGEQIIDLTGLLWDGRRFAGFDFIRVIH